MADLVNENKIGVTKGTVVEAEVDQNFKGETSEVGLYLAMVRQAQREGYPEIAGVLKSLAWDEAWARAADPSGRAVAGVHVDAYCGDRVK